MEQRAKFSCLAGLGLMAAIAAPSLHAAPAGRVLAAAGAPTAVRDGAEIKLSPGVVIEDRDVLSTGPGATLQVRFTDDSIVALRERSQLRIDEYRFEDKGSGAQRAFFSLVKGGFRTLTGLIGRTRHDDYKVSTPTATIGIRGTHFALAECQQDCRAGDGSAEPDGLYGSVLGPASGTNRIAVANAAGETLIGQNQHFYVADSQTGPKFLLEPPGFLLDRLGGVKPSSSAKLAEAGSASRGDITAESRVQTPPPPLAQVSQATIQTPFIATQGVQASGMSAALSVSEQAVQFQPVGSSGLIRGQLVWLTSNDLDLHLRLPGGGHVYYGNTTVTQGGGTFKLDRDNLGGTINVPPNKRIENIASSGTPPAGTYAFYVHNFNGPSVSPVLTVTGDGGVTARTHNVPVLAPRAVSSNYNVIYSPGVAPVYTTTSPE